MNLGNATGQPRSFMNTSFANQVLAQIELYSNIESYPLGIHVLPKIWDEKVAMLHLDALGVELTELTEGQAKYLGVDKTDPISCLTTVRII